MDTPFWVTVAILAAVLAVGLYRNWFALWASEADLRAQINASKACMRQPVPPARVAATGSPNMAPDQPLTALLAVEMQRLHDTVYRLTQFATAAHQPNVPDNQRNAFAGAVHALQVADAELRATELVLDGHREQGDQVYRTATVVFAPERRET